MTLPTSDENWILDAKDWEVFIAALENPTEASNNLRSAALLYNEWVSGNRRTEDQAFNAGVAEN
jgi:hypothetical protein